MSAAAKSILVFGVYLVVLGLSLVFFPQIIVSFGLPAPLDVWVRGFGLLVFLIGVYYLLAVKEKNVAFFRWTVYIRPLVILFFTGFVLAGYAPPVLLIAGVIDLVGATWTGLTLRADVKSQA